MARNSEAAVDIGIEKVKDELTEARGRLAGYEEIVNSDEHRDYERDVAKYDKARADLLDALPLKYKQFIAHRKNYTARLLREEVRNMAQKGLKECWVVTPRTAALVEGFLSGDEGNGQLPYELKDGHVGDLSIGDKILHAGDEYVVIERLGDNLMRRVNLGTFVGKP